jgi:acyl-CoA thioester hydrolase
MAWQYTLHLRFTDLDYLGHVTAAAYFAQFDEARARWLADIWQTPRPAYVVVRQEIEYLREVLLENSPVVIAVAAARLGTSSFDIEEELTTSGGVVHARSRATLVHWDADRRRAAPLTEAQRAALGAGR